MRRRLTIGYRLNEDGLKCESRNLFPCYRIVTLDDLNGIDLPPLDDVSSSTYKPLQTNNLTHSSFAMNRSSTLQTLKSSFSALVLIGALALTGCSASTISGPDLAPSDEPAVEETSTLGADHNEGEARKDGDDSGQGGSTTNGSGASHNN